MLAHRSHFTLLPLHLFVLFLLLSSYFDRELHALPKCPAERQYLYYAYRLDARKYSTGQTNRQNKKRTSIRELCIARFFLRARDRTALSSLPRPHLTTATVGVLVIVYAACIKYPPRRSHEETRPQSPCPPALLSRFPFSVKHTRQVPL